VTQKIKPISEIYIFAIV